MDLVFSRLDDSVARFTIHGATSAFANALRRSMIGEVPTLAIEDVKIYDNTSVLFDEMLAHRLGLIPLKTDLSTYKPRAECDCGGAGCPACQVTFTLSVEGPKMVTSGDLVSMDEKAVPVLSNIPIIKLWEGQKVVLEATAEVNYGKEHAKWQPTLACGYSEYPVIKVAKSCDGCGKCIDDCPRDVLEIVKNKVAIRNVNGESKEKDCSMCKICMNACRNTGNEESAITIDSDPTKFIFVVEGDGSLPVKEIIERALLHIKSVSADMIEALQEGL